MINSDYVRDILWFSINGEEYQDILLQQIEHLSIKQTEYTGIGRYYYFEHSAEIEKYRLIPAQLVELFGNFNHMLENTIVINDRMNFRAYPILWLDGGLIIVTY